MQTLKRNSKNQEFLDCGQKVETTQVPMDRWTDNPFYAYTTFCLLDNQIKEIMTRDTALMNPENITQGEISQVRKDKYCEIPLLSNI